MSQKLLLNRPDNRSFWDMLCEKWDKHSEKWDKLPGPGPTRHMPGTRLSGR